MIRIQLFTILFITASLSFFIFYLLHKFERKATEALIFTIPLINFSTGFILRLSKRDYLVDLGFYLMSIATLFVSISFAVFLFLGQLKYWRK